MYIATALFLGIGVLGFYDILHDGVLASGSEWEKMAVLMGRCMICDTVYGSSSLSYLVYVARMIVYGYRLGLWGCKTTRNGFIRVNW